MTFKEPKLVHAIEVLTGVNGRGLLDGGEVQVSADGTKFTTVAKLDKGAAKVVLKDNRVRAVRLLAESEQSEPLVVRAINLRLMVEVSGAVHNPNAAIGAGNVAVIKGDTEFAYPIGACTVPVINRDFTLKLDNGGNPCSYSGPISGSGKVEIYAGGPECAADARRQGSEHHAGHLARQGRPRRAGQGARRRRPRRHDHRRRPGDTTACSGTPATRSTTPPTSSLLSSDKGGPA